MSGGWSLAVAVTVVAWPQLYAFQEIAPPPNGEPVEREKIVEWGGLATNLGHKGCSAANDKWVRSLSLGRYGRVYDYSVGLGDSISIPCTTEKLIADLGLIGDKGVAELCWLHRPSMRAIAVGRFTASGPLGISHAMHRYQVDSDTMDLLVGSAQMDDDGTFDCILRLPFAETFLTRVRLTVFDCERNPCYAGVCNSTKLAGKAVRANCTCADPEILKGRWCDSMKDEHADEIPLWLITPLLVSGGFIMLMIAIAFFVQSPGPKLALPSFDSVPTNQSHQKGD